MKKIFMVGIIMVMMCMLGNLAWAEEKAPSDIVTLMDVVLSKISAMVQPNTLIGSPITMGNVTVVPVIKVDVGFGGGGGLGQLSGQPSGGGTGGGITLEPVSFLIIQGENVTLLSATTPSSPWKEIIEKVLPMIMQGMQGIKGMSGMPGGMPEMPETPLENQ
ncbi:MAG: spore germination protein GerW family protein [Candidatus Atribacteria bacterium]|nr:spore germination protein GerW family protein [Candidatus Atribacteria bacterium]